MIGYRLSWRHEPGFAIDLEDSINTMLLETQTEDVTLAGKQYTKNRWTNRQIDIVILQVLPLCS